MDGFLEVSWAWFAGWGALRWAPARWGVGAFFYARFLKWFFSVFGEFWEVFGGQNGSQDQVLGVFFSMFVSNAFWHRFLRVFGRSETWKIAIFLKENNDFYKIDVFEKVSKKPRFWSHFRRRKPWKIEKKRCWKPCVFLTSTFHRFFSIFRDFGSIWGGPGTSKNR